MKVSPKALFWNIVAAVFVIPMLVRSCGPVENRYATLDDVRQAGAMDRGWLPPVLPESAVDIREENDLDLNLGSGSFSFSPEELDGYLARLRDELQAITKVDSGQWNVSFSKGEFEWTMVLPADGRGAKYRVGPRR